MKTIKRTIGDDGKLRTWAVDTDRGFIYGSCYAKDFQDKKIFEATPPTAEELVDEINA